MSQFEVTKKLPGKEVPAWRGLAKGRSSNGVSGGSHLAASHTASDQDSMVVKISHPKVR